MQISYRNHPEYPERWTPLPKTVKPRSKIPYELELMDASKEDIRFCVYSYGPLQFTCFLSPDNFVEMALVLPAEDPENQEDEDVCFHKDGAIQKGKHLRDILDLIGNILDVKVSLAVNGRRIKKALKTLVK